MTLLLFAALMTDARAASPPDMFHTTAAIHQHTGGLTDPLDHDCAIPGGALTFPAAVDLALCRNPQTRAAWAGAHAQAAALGAAESSWLPTITATGAETRDFGPHVDELGNQVNSAQNSGDAVLALQWTLYDFGARSAKIKSARRLLDAAALTVNSTAQQTVRTVVQAYYGVVGADALLLAAKTTEAVTDRSVEIARALREGGVGTAADVLQADTAHGQSLLTRIQADAQAKSAHGTLSVTLGLTADQPLILAPEPVPAEVPPLTARIADLMAEAARQRPDLAAAQSQRDSAEADVTVARAVGRPSISIGAQHSVIFQSGLPNENYNQIGLNVTVPIFSGFSVNYGVRQAQAVLESREANVEQTGLTVTLDVWNAYYNLDSANQQLVITAALVKTAEDNQEVSLGRYQSGVGTIVDVLTAQSAAAIARQTRINAEFGWKLARAQLALALGRLTSADPLKDGAALP